MRENFIAATATRVEKSGDAHSRTSLALTKYWERHEGLAQIGERYLSRAKIRKEAGGILFIVPTSFHLKVIQPWKEVLESTLNEKIVGFEVSREERKAPSVDFSRSQFQQTQQHQNQQQAHADFSSQLPSTQLSIQLAPVNPQVDRVEKERMRRIMAPFFVNSPALEVPTQLVSRWANQIKYGNQVLWVYGAPGSGKTTLLRQLNHWISLDYRMEFIDVMSFFHEWRKALDQNNTFAFIKKYRRETDVFVLENIEELRGKVGTQQELLFTLNTLSDRGASFAVSSSLSPQDLKDDLDPQLYSRLLSGLAVELAVPDRCFKENLWRHLMEQHGLSAVQVDLGILEKLFNLKLSTARKVQTVFINAIARLSVSGRLQLQDIYEFEGIHAPQVLPMTSTGMNPRQLIERVAKLSGISTSAVLGKGRRADVVLARKFIFLSLSRMLGMTNTSIAHYVEKDPSTVCHALKTIQDDLVNNRHVAKQWNWICSELGLKETSYSTH